MNETSLPSRHATLMRFLAHDPGNLPLLADAAEAAFDEGQPEAAIALLERHAEIAPLTSREINLMGLAALRTRQFARAATAFASLIDHDADDPALRFNLAWAHASDKDFDAALAVLDDASATALPQAAALRVQLLHQVGAIDDAAVAGRNYLIHHQDHHSLLAAVSVVAIDVEDETLAAECAAAAGDHPDALTTLGTLALRNEHSADAVALFRRALAHDEGLPRAWIGSGLAKLLGGDAPAAAVDIDRGATMFGDHLGSWIAAGWAHFVSHDLDAARARFDTALAIDDTFAESHGALAVLDAMTGQTEAARRRCDIALRLDPRCYSAALAQSLLATGDGDPERARRLVELALRSPIDDSGRTIGDALARTGLGFR